MPPTRPGAGHTIGPGPAAAAARFLGPAPLPEHLHPAHRHHRHFGASHSRFGASPHLGGLAGGGPMSAVGRFAPTPSGRMHLGNLVFCPVSWLSVRSQGGEWILRMEDLDTQRCRQDYAQRLRQDLIRLGLTWDREAPPQSMRTESLSRGLSAAEGSGPAVSLLLYPGPTPQRKRPS